MAGTAVGHGVNLGQNIDVGWAVKCFAEVRRGNKTTFPSLLELMDLFVYTELAGSAFSHIDHGRAQPRGSNARCGRMC